MSDDAISADVGDEAENINLGKRNTQTSQRADPRQTVTVTGDNSGNQWLIAQILDHGQQIRELAYRLDDIPNKFQALQADVKKLQDVEITVKSDAVTIKPITSPEASNLSMQTLLIAMVIGFVSVCFLVLAVYWWM